MPIELPTPDIIDKYRAMMEQETIAHLCSNGYSKTPREKEILLYGFREGFNKAKAYFFGLVKIT